jgi:hypothetical protein
MPSIWFIVFFSAVVWTLFLLMQHIWPQVPAALLLLLALAGGLASAYLDMRFSLPNSQRSMWDRLLLFLASLAVGFLYGSSVYQWYLDGIGPPRPTMYSFVQEGPALLILFTILVNISHRRRLALTESRYSLAAKSAGEGMTGLCVSATAWIYLPAIFGADAKSIYLLSFVFGQLAMAAFTWIVPCERSPAPWPRLSDR